MWKASQLTPICFLPLLAFRAVAQGAPSDSNSAHVPNYAHTSNMRALLHWERFPLHVFFPASRLASAERKQLALAGFDEWVQATHGIVCYRVVTKETGAELVVNFISHTRTSGFSTVGGRTTITCEGALLKKVAIEIVEKDDDPAGFQTICAHEFGHALGIDGHSDDEKDMMFPVLTLTLFTVRNDEIALPTPARTVTRRDVNTLLTAYPLAIFSEKR